VRPSTLHKGQDNAFRTEGWDYNEEIMIECETLRDKDGVNSDDGCKGRQSIVRMQIHVQVDGTFHGESMCACACVCVVIICLMLAWRRIPLSLFPIDKGENDYSTVLGLSDDTYEPLGGGNSSFCLSWKNDLDLVLIFTVSGIRGLGRTGLLDLGNGHECIQKAKGCGGGERTC